MDILYELSYLFFENAESLENKPPEYRNLKEIEGKLLGQLPEELRGKLIDIQAEIAYRNLLHCFLYGLQVGYAASNLGQCG